MRTLLRPAFLHPPTGDPGVYVDVPDEGRAAEVLREAGEAFGVPVLEMA